MDNLMTLVSKLNNEFNNYIVKELEKSGVKGFAVSHGNILINFMNTEEMNYRELSRRINKSPQTMTTLVRKLENEGYLTMNPDPTDKCNKLVRLTQKGKDFLPIMNNISVTLFEKQYIGIKEPEQELLRTLLSNIIFNMKE